MLMSYNQESIYLCFVFCYTYFCLNNSPLSLKHPFNLKIINTQTHRLNKHSTQKKYHQPKRTLMSNLHYLQTQLAY